MKYILISILTLWTTLLSAQRITIDFPHFAGKEYMWFLWHGDRQDTLAHGTLDAKGQTVLTVPSAYREWQGMSNFLLTAGGGLEIVLNGEQDFIVGCAVAAPTIDDIYYTGSPENTFLIEQYKQQQRLLQKAEIIAVAMQTYTPDEPFYQPLSAEKTTLENRFTEFQKQTAETPFYAARIRQMLDYFSGLGSRLDLTEEEFNDEQRAFVRDILDFEQLWKSGFWKNLFARWMSFETAQSDSILLADSKALLARIPDGEVREMALKKMITLFHQYGKETLLMQLPIPVVETDGRPSLPILMPGHPAPKLYLTDNENIVPLNSLLFFYESECGNCENELLTLHDNYPIFQKKNINVITISADTDEIVYRKNADLFPWQQKLCDFKGFGGINFKNYGIIGTPTIFLIDENGVITGRYAQIREAIDNEQLTIDN